MTMPASPLAVPPLAPDPGPNDLDAVLAHHVAEQGRLTGKALDRMANDAGLTLVPCYTEQVRQVARPLQARLADLERQQRAGHLTSKGYEAEASRARVEFHAALDAMATRGERELQAAMTETAAFGEVPAPSAEEEQEAMQLVQALPLLTPAHGLPRLTRTLRDAIRGERLGVLAALTPYLKSLYEAPGTAYTGSLPLRALVERAETALAADFRRQVSHQRLQSLERAGYYFGQLVRIARATDGIPERDIGFRATTAEGQRVFGAY